MLQVTIPATELFNEKTDEIISIKSTTLQLEHSLVSISKWESKWCKPFFGTKANGPEPKTVEETLDYIRCMTLTKNVDPNVYLVMPASIIKQITEYIDAPMTATWFSEDKNGKHSGHEVITNELVYYWMIANNIPMECQKWHFNRLMTLIRVCSIKNAPPKKMSKHDILSRNAALNAARRKQFNTKG